MFRTLFVGLAATLALPSSAWACGGFFCNTDQPVDQSAEEILFAVDSASDTTTMHVQVEYEGPADEFSWVVPVAGVPDLGIGTRALFDALRGASAQHWVRYETAGDCWQDYGWGSGSGTGTGTGTGTGAYTTSTASSPGGGVTIVGQATVGPYETVTLQATDAGSLVQWLGDNGYDMPPGFDDVIAPYVTEDGAFVALKLVKDTDAGDLAPLTLTYPGTTPAIPIQLTSVAATPDMRLRVYVLGEARAVPESYLHVQLNPLAIDWWRPWETNYEEVVSLAADEAGGHAFATDFAGPPRDVVGSLYSASWTEERLAETTDAFEFLQVLQDYGYPATQELLDVLLVHVPPPQGMDPTGFYNCIWCYETELRAMPFDPAAAAADVWAFVVEPRMRADEVLDSAPWLTRMTSSISPVEMTVDPVFVFNEDMGEQPLVREAVDTTLCYGDGDYSTSGRVFEVEEQWVVPLPSREWFWNNGMTEFDYLKSLGEPAAAVIERTSGEGQPEILVDNRPAITTSVNAFRDANGDLADGAPRGCGCDSSGAPAGGLALLGLMGLVGRRRR